MLRNALFFLGLFALHTPLVAQSLVESGQNLPGLWAGAAAWGDYDNDGDQDLALIGEVDEGGQCLRIARIYGNNEALLFGDQAPGQQLIGVYHGDLAWGDYDNDGDLDLALAGENVQGSILRVTEFYRNKPTGTLTLDSELTSQTKLSGGSLAWGDYDGGGNLDLAQSGASTADFDRGHSSRWKPATLLVGGRST